MDATYPFVDNFKLTYIGPSGDQWVASDTKLYRKLSSSWQVSSFIPVPIKSIWQSSDGQTVYLAVGGGYSYSGLWRSSDRGENFTQDPTIYSLVFSTNFLISTSSYLYVAGNYTSGGVFMFRTPLSSINTPSWTEVNLNGSGFTIYPAGLAVNSGQLLMLSSGTYSGIFSLDESGQTWTNVIYHSDLAALDSDGTTTITSFSPANSSVAQVAVSPGYSFSAVSGTYSLGKPLLKLARVSGAFIGSSSGLGSAGLWRSTDNGFHWILVDSNVTNNVYGSGTTLLAATTSQILESTDTGLSWNCDSCTVPSSPTPPPPAPPVSTKHPVILIHGIGGHPENWRSFEHILLSTGYSSSDISEFSYSDSQPYNYQGDIYSIGSRLSSFIDAKSAISTDGRVDILGFSMGGVVGRSGLLSNLVSAGKVRNFINVGVPNLGSYLATFFVGDTLSLPRAPGLLTLARNYLLNQVVNIFRGGDQPLDVNSPAVQELRIGSSFLASLNSQSLPSNIKTYSIFGDEKILLHQKILFLDLKKEFSLGDLVVDTSSGGTIPGAIPEQSAYGETPQIDVHLLRSSFAAEYNFVGNPEGMKYFHNNLLSQPEIKNKILEILSSP